MNSDDRVMDETNSTPEERIKAWLGYCDLYSLLSGIPAGSSHTLGLIQEDKAGNKTLIAEFEAESFFKDISTLVGFTPLFDKEGEDENEE